MASKKKASAGIVNNDIIEITGVKVEKLHLVKPVPMPFQLPIKFQVSDQKKATTFMEPIRNTARSWAIARFKLVPHTVRTRMIGFEYVEVYQQL